jgi:hypothetical protein
MSISRTDSALSDHDFFVSSGRGGVPLVQEEVSLLDTSPIFTTRSRSKHGESVRRHRPGLLGVAAGALMSCLVGVVVVAGAALPATADTEQAADSGVTSTTLAPEDVPAERSPDAAEAESNPAADELVDQEPLSADQLESSATDPQPMSSTSPTPIWDGPIYEEPPFPYELDGPEYMVTNLRVVSFGDGRATLAWDLPLFERDTGYKVSHLINADGRLLGSCITELSDICWAGNQPPFVIRGLVAGQEYTAAVRAGFANRMPDAIAFGHKYGKPVFITFTMPESIPAPPEQAPDPAVTPRPEATLNPGAAAPVQVAAAQESVSRGSATRPVELARTGLDPLLPLVPAGVLVASGGLLFASRRRALR